MSKSMKDLARDALAVQNACNLSGVVHSFSQVMKDLRELLPNAGTDAINTHPISVLWSDKIAHLTGTQDLGNDKVGRAYDWAYAEVEKP